MIQIEGIQIENFRGIRNLNLDFGSDSFVVVGPNGTGKSGVVDALEFALTGNVSRLSGQGSGELGLTSHAPHVLSSEDPNAAKVSITVRDVSSGEISTLSRSVGGASEVLLDPESEAVRAAVERIGSHPEIVLSRREIIKFILTPPSDRAENVQTLLRLGSLSKMRASLRNAKGKLTSSASASKKRHSDAETDVVQHFDLPELIEDDILNAINARRTTLGIEPLPSLDVEDVSTGVASEGRDRTANKATAQQDLSALEVKIDGEAPVRALTDDLESAVAPTFADPTLVQELGRKDLVDSGLDLVVDDRCPLCDHTWPSVNALRSHLLEKVERLAKAGEMASRIEDAGRELAAEVGAIANVIGVVRRAATDLDQTTAGEELGKWEESLRKVAAKVGTVPGALSLEEGFFVDPLPIPKSASESLAVLVSVVGSLPDVSRDVEAASFLGRAQDRLARLRDARTEFTAAATAEDSGDAVYEAYCNAQDAVLERLYASVASTFADYYRSMNSDEGSFTVRLEPDEQQLRLLVDFYEQGMFPPAAYHSEGHQDGMGVSLYLALMKHQLGDDFRLAVLDDVVMSVDAGHRRQFCELLKTEFPNVQFIITTHDPLWANQLVKSRLVRRKRQLRISRWDIDSGPWVAAGADFWDDIENALNNNDVQQAASRLRHSLEWILSDLADHYRCPIPYSSTATYDLGEYLNAVKGRYRGLLAQAAEAASSWNKAEAEAEVAAAKSIWSAASLAQETEQWVVNPAIHYNEWATFSKSDFQPVVEAWKEFLSVFECSECDGRLYVTKSDGKDDTLRCDCGDTNLNLRKKP